MTLSRYKKKHIYAQQDYQGKTYDLIFGHPYDMLRDKNISWEAKGYLSYIFYLDGSEIEFSPFVLAELVHFGYLVEVNNENSGT